MKSLLSIRSIWSLYFFLFFLFYFIHSESWQNNQALDSTLIFIIYSSRTRLHRGIIKQNSKLDHAINFILLDQNTNNRIELRKTVKIRVVIVIRYWGTSPKLGGCQGECPYPYDHISFFGGGDDGVVDDVVPHFERRRYSNLRMMLWRVMICSCNRIF